MVTSQIAVYYHKKGPQIISLVYMKEFFLEIYYTAKYGEKKCLAHFK